MGDDRGSGLVDTGAVASPSDEVPAPPAPPAPAPPRALRALRRHLVLVAAIGVVAAAAAAIGARAWADHHSITSIRPQGIPANVPTDIANLMGLDRVPDHPAPGFSLTDQQGDRVSLSSFRGHPVVLDFMDSHCTDICPIVSQELVDASHDLGHGQPSTVFLAVNVNPYHAKVSDVAAFSRLHQLDTIPTWHFLTGPVPVLQRIWDRYGITVDAAGPNTDVVHTSLMVFIGRSGRERFVAAPEVDHTKSGSSFLPSSTLTGWGRGIAVVARDITH